LSAGASPQNPLGQLTALPLSPAVFRGLLLRRGKGKGGVRQRRGPEGGEGKRGGEEGEGRRGKGRGPHDRLAWRPQCFRSKGVGKGSRDLLLKF